ncbi:methyl-accepting chemotaxis protein [Desulfofundulus thermocisternus]|uniref:methyl-accepting chemotaxis protein n=1 Tax=Desulfofundulus thermocisternus TaxID=42471 RepID=UPI00068F5BB7|nr:methyl-accepting chemotaxis protein [Desulfofundulus thermocisternus]
MGKLRRQLVLLTSALALLAVAATLLAGWLARGSVPATLAGAAAGILLAGVLAAFAFASLQATVNMVIVNTDKAIAGDLTGKIEDRHFGWGEINRLVTNIRKVLKGVHKWFGLVREYSERLTAATAQITSGTEQISTGSQEQAGQVQKLLQEIENLAQSARQSAEKARQTADVARETDLTARQGGQAVDRVIESMNLIHEKIKTLDESSARIGQFVQVIEDIAAQTNLLALNAAIEAARAGEHGRGFAVVAQEVRELAENSARATREITQLVAGIQGAAGESVAAVERGLQVTGEVQEAFRNIVSQIERTVESIEELASASQEQAASTEQMVGGVEAIAAVAEQAAASCQETAAITGELSGLADRLKSVAEIWKFNQDGGEDKRKGGPHVDAQEHKNGAA